MNKEEFWKKWSTAAKLTGDKERFMKDLTRVIKETEVFEPPEYYLVFDPASKHLTQLITVESITHYLETKCRNYAHADWNGIRIVGVIDVEAWRPKRNLKVDLEQIDL